MTTEPVHADIVAAAERLRGHIVRTPLLEWPALSKRLDGRIFIKPEMLQRTGAFKIRGAWNAIAAIEDGLRANGVVAFSSGNHGQAVAAAAAAHGMRATIVMPADAPEIKIESTRAHGAGIVLYDRAGEDREAIALRIVGDTGARLIPPFDDPRIIAGQGTAGLEIARDLRAMGLTPDAVLVPVSGGGLIAGTAIALSHDFPDTEIVAVEPTGFDDMARSLKSGVRETVRPGAETFCDALRVATPGVLTFSIIRRLVARGLAVEDRDTAAAMAALFSGLKLVAEPGGAVALAAVMNGAYTAAGKTVVVLCSGGNVGLETFRRVLSP